MSKYLLLCSLFFLIERAFAATPACGANSIFSECACCRQHHCGSLFYNGGVDLIQCPNGCDKGCICSDGFYYNELTQQCCHPERCNKPCCPANRIYRDCGTDCPPTCDNPKPTFCTKQCVRGCFCKDGLVEDGNGNCIPLEKCPTKCPPNEILDSCINPCQPTCLEPFRPACQNLLCQKGCVCRPPLVRDEASGKCVDKRICDRQCPRPNEAYYMCKPCLRVCGTCQRTRCPPPKECVPGCQCKPGYVWHPIKKICVPPEFCNC